VRPSAPLRSTPQRAAAEADQVSSLARVADGVIIGSAFIQLLKKTERAKRREVIKTFIRGIREG